jgi:hypothetical protein
MAISVTGSVQPFVFTGANPASQNATIPSDAKAVLVFFVGHNSLGWSVTSVTLGGNSMNVAGLAAVGDVSSGPFCAFLGSPPTGTQGLDPLFSQDSSGTNNGPTCLLVCLTASGTISLIDRDFDADEGTATSSATSSSNTGDYAIACAHTFDATPVHNGSSLGSGQTNNGQRAQLFTLTAGASTTTATSGSSDYPTVALAILRESGGGGGGLVTRKLLLGVGKRALDRHEWTRRDDSQLYTRKAA